MTAASCETSSRMRFQLAAAVATACAAAAAINPWPLEGVVDSARANAANATLLRPTGFKRADYLPVINGIVGAFIQYQNANGSIIDPYANEEIQYATPTFAMASAVLVGTNYNASVLGNSVRALTAALTELSNGYAPQGHTNFFTFPIMMAFWQLKPLVSAAQVSAWEGMLRAIDPAIYKTDGNWGLVAVGGEYLRTSIAGYGNASWWQQELATQFAIGEFTPNGQYQDHSGMDGLNPVPYDLFPSGYLTVMLAQGYNNTGIYGGLSATIEEEMTRAAWTHLLMQSPWGEIPTGGRSSQHSWNEAAASAVYEIQAGRYAAAGDAQAACMFKRAAHLSLGSVKRWQNPAGDLQIVKNYFPPVDRWGYEVYSFYSQYNLLPASQLATAYLFTDDSIDECATFADVGGFAFQLPEFNLVIANAGGTYAEIETGSDPHYDTTGLTRVHINNCATQSTCTAVHTLMSPTAGPPQENGGFGYGIWWSTQQQGNNVIQHLGNLNFTQVTSAVMTAAPGWSPASVAFSVQYVVVEQNLIITENYNVQSTGVISVDASLQMVGRSNDAITRFGVTCPVFQFDGVTNTTVSYPAGLPTTASLPVSVSAAGGAQWGNITCTVTNPGSNHKLSLNYNPAAPTVTRNGLSVPADVEVTPLDSQTPSLSYTIAGSGVATSN